MNSEQEPQPNEIELHRAEARSLTRSLDFNQALAAWQRVEALHPGDAEAAQSIARLIIDQSRQRLGLATHAQAVTAPAAEDQQSSGNGQPDANSGGATGRHSAAPPASEFRRTPIQELEIAIREFPSNADYYLQLVPLYLEKGREYDAERLLDKGREATAGDPRVCQLWEEVTMQRMEKRLALAEKHRQAEDTPQTRAELEEIRAERDQLEMNIFLGRCKREPRNAAARIQLALRLRRAGKIHEACQRLEEALCDPVHKSAAALELGRCHEVLAEPAEALRYYRLAADSATQPAHLSSQKEALYAASQLAERLKLHKLASRYSAELLRLSPQDQYAITPASNA